MLITSYDDALIFLDGRIRLDYASAFSMNPASLGRITQLQETEVNGHKVWLYNFERLPLPLEGLQRWLIDTGETISTTPAEDENTIDKAYFKYYGKQLVPPQYAGY